LKIDLKLVREHVRVFTFRRGMSGIEQVVSACTPARTVSKTMGLDFGAMLKLIKEIFQPG
jgi:hypothetical protein